MDELIYFDNAATTYPKPEEVYRAMDNFYREYGFSAGRGQYSQAFEVNKIINDTRGALKKLFNCRSSQQIVFTPSATVATNVILQGLDWSKIHNVYITHFEHNAVLRLLHQIKKKKEFDINFIDTKRETKNNKVLLSYDIESIKYQFQDNKPDLVVMTHASNVCGLVTPIKEISNLAKEFNSTVVIDCAQTAGLLDIDLHKINADYIVFAGHKTLYGPFGIAGFTIDSMSKLEPLIYGGTGTDSANMELPSESPQKYEVGSQNTHAISGLNASLKWIEQIGRENIEKKEKILLDSFIRMIEQYNNILFYVASDFSRQIGIVSCVFDGYQSSNIGQVLSQNNIAVRTGLHCAPNAHKFIGSDPGGTVRFSFGYFNDESEIQRLSDVIEHICFG